MDRHEEYFAPFLTFGEGDEVRGLDSFGVAPALHSTSRSSVPRKLVRTYCHHTSMNTLLFRKRTKIIKTIWLACGVMGSGLVSPSSWPLHRFFLQTKCHTYVADEQFPYTTHSQHFLPSSSMFDRH